MCFALAFPNSDMMYRAGLWSWVILISRAIVRLFGWVLIRVGWCRGVIIFIGRFGGMFVGIGWWDGLVLVVGSPVMVGGWCWLVVLALGLVEGCRQGRLVVVAFGRHHQEHHDIKHL